MGIRRSQADRKIEIWRIPGHCEKVAHIGVAIPRLDAPLLVDEFQKSVQKNGLYDDM